MTQILIVPFLQVPTLKSLCKNFASIVAHHGVSLHGKRLLKTVAVALGLKSWDDLLAQSRRQDCGELDWERVIVSLAAFIGAANNVQADRISQLLEFCLPQELHVFVDHQQALIQQGRIDKEYAMKYCFTEDCFCRLVRDIELIESFSTEMGCGTSLVNYPATLRDDWASLAWC